MAANAAYIVANQGMHDYLEDVLDVDNAALRLNLMRGGFRSPAALVTKKKDFVHSVCTNIRKSGGLAGPRNIGAELEENLEKFVLWCRYRYLTQRNLAFAEATMVSLDAISIWCDQLQKDPDPLSVDKFTDGIDRRQWFESIQNYLGLIRGAAKLPLAYAIKEEDDLPAVDSGFGMPDFDEDLATRGRIQGSFWKADNTTVWQFLKSKCHGTDAWTVILGFNTRKDGRGAYFALVRMYMGCDVKQLLCRRAETFLENVRFDGKSRNFIYPKFVGKLRLAFQDLSREDPLSERRKVNKLMRAFQVESLRYLDAHVTGHDTRSCNFEEAVTFLSDQMTALETKNTGSNRTVAAFGQGSDSDTSGSYRPSKKSVHTKKFKTKHSSSSKTGRSGSAKKGSSGSGKKDPLEFLTGKEWYHLSEEQKASKRKARRAAGIPTSEERMGKEKKKISSVKRAASSSDSDSSSEDRKPTKRQKRQVISSIQRSAADSDSDSSSDESGNESTGARPAPRMIKMTQRKIRQDPGPSKKQSKKGKAQG
jgi:hypothetical protein